MLLQVSQTGGKNYILMKIGLSQIFNYKNGFSDENLQSIMRD